MTMRDEGLDLDDAIGQCFMVGFHGAEPSPELIALIERDRVGSVILFSRNCRGGPRQLRALTARLQAIARAADHPRPLLIAIDQENGLVRRLEPGPGDEGPQGAPTQFPGNMALGATGDPALTEAVTRASGEELHALGINLNLAPVADVNNNPANPVIGVRAFGEDPAIVARHVAAAVRGYTAGGVIATLKHFPGHGDTATDSHLGLPLVAHDRARLEAVELPPFRAGIDAGAECVLTAHVALPALTGGRVVPATLAPEVVRGLLRGELGYTGAVVTDCLEMDAIAREVGVVEAAVAALQAGNDIVLISHQHDRQREALAAVRAAVAQGMLALDTLHEAAAHVLRLKRGLSWESSPPGPGPLAPRGEGEAESVGASGGRPAWGEGAAETPGEEESVVGSAAHHALSADAYARSITLVRDRAQLLPMCLAAGQQLFVVAWRGPVNSAIDALYTPEAFAAALRTLHPDVSLATLARAPVPDELRALREQAAAAEVTLLLTLNAHRDPAQAELMRTLAAAARQALMIAVADPYDAATLRDVPGALATYDYSVPALQAAAQALFAADPPPGKLPVSLEA